MRRFLIAAFILCTALHAGAAPIPSAERPVSLMAREQPIGAFLQDLFGQIDVPVSMAASVKGQVSGNFNGPAEKVLRDVSRSFGLVTYYDGSVVHVYSAGDMVTRTMPASVQVGERVLRAVQDGRLTDARHTLRLRDGNLTATGTRRFIEQVDEIYRANHVASAALPPMGFKVFYLRYAWAQDVTVTFGGRQLVVPGVASILRSLVTSGPQTTTVAGEQLLRPTQPKLRGQGMARVASADAANILGFADAAPKRTDDDGVLPAANGQATAAPAVVALGDARQVRIEAEPRLNAVIVRDAPQRLAQYEQLVAALDVEPQLLEIEATIIDVNTDRLRELGINWRWSNAGNALLFGRGDASDLRLNRGQDVTPMGRGGFISAVLGHQDQFIARINALQTEGAARVVSSPQVITLSNVEAVFDNSKTFYVKVAGNQEVDLFNVSAGTQLRVTPHVFKDEGNVRIKLLVAIEDGSVSGEEFVERIPVVERSTINTQAIIQEGESLLLGGLVRERSGKTVDKVPVLGDVPVLGHLFRSKQDASSRVERMFLITPRLAAPGRSTAAAKSLLDNTPAPRTPAGGTAQ